MTDNTCMYVEDLFGLINKYERKDVERNFKTNMVRKMIDMYLVDSKDTIQTLIDLHDHICESLYDYMHQDEGIEDALLDIYQYPEIYDRHTITIKKLLQYIRPFDNHVPEWTHETSLNAKTSKTSSQSILKLAITNIVLTAFNTVLLLRFTRKRS